MLGVSHKALPAAEQFLLARFFMYKTVYHHKTTFGMEEACRQLLRRMRDEGTFDMPQTGEDVLKLVRSPKLAGFTDEYVDGLVREASQKGDSVMKALADCIEKRRPPKLLKEVQVFEDDDHMVHNRGRTFRSKAIQSLRDLADRYGIPVGQFLCCQTKPLKLEKRPARITAEQARELPSEQEDELIKVFVDESPGAEPKSLVGIPHSMIGTCAKHSWQAFRLYVVYDGENRSDVVANLREEVANWGS